MLKKSGFRQESSYFKGKKERKPDLRIALVWRYKETNLIMWRSSLILVQQGERVTGTWTRFFFVFIICHNKEIGNTIRRVFCVRVCVFVCECARARGQHVATTPGPGEPSWWSSTPSLSFQTSCRYIHSQLGFHQWVLQKWPRHASKLLLPPLGGFQGDSEHSEHWGK